MQPNLQPGENPQPAFNFPAGLAHILERINLIDPTNYSKTRNFINGAVTYLSPYISRGVISVDQVMETVLQKGYNTDEIEKFLQELAWREYFQRVLQHKGDKIWDDIKQPQDDVLHHQMPTAIENAATGIEAIDQAILKLCSSGYMHNHVRMYTASLACNIAKAHWLQPSRWMYYHLLDGDIASNNCSWQWVAGTFTSKKYYFNQENVNKYTFSIQQGSFLDEPYATIVSMPVPEMLQSTGNLLLETKLPVTKLPQIDSSKPTLIYNSYNLDVRWRNDEDVNRMLLLEPSHFKKFPVSDKVLKFIIDLSKNIDGLQLFTGEIGDIDFGESLIISKEHPLFMYYPGIKDTRDWMFPEVTAYYPSFSAYWKVCKKFLSN